MFMERSKATWQSILLNSRMDCFSRQVGIAMTKNKCVFRMNMVFIFCKSDRLIAGETVPKSLRCRNIWNDIRNQPVVRIRLR